MRNVGPEGTDLQMPTCRRIEVARYAPSRAIEVTDASRRSGLYGPTATFSLSAIFKSRWHTEDAGPEGTDLQMPTCRRIDVARYAPSRAIEVTDASGRSGLYGPTATFSLSAIFKSRWRTEDVGPEGTDLQADSPRVIAHALATRIAA